MKSYGRDVVGDLLLLSFTAGSADAAGFLGLGHIFTSNMTGNVVLFGLALGQGDDAQAYRAFYVLLVFLLGTAIGSWQVRDTEGHDWPLLVRSVLILELAALSAFALAWFYPVDRVIFSYPLITLLTFALGLQAAVMNRLSVPGVGTTAITGTLTSLVSGLVKKVSTPVENKLAHPESSSRLKFQASVVLIYTGAAILSGVLMSQAPRTVGLLSVLPVLFIVLRERAKGLRH